jgi:hypothetical protein
MPLQTYRKLVKVCTKTGGTPEYFAYDKVNKRYFFISENLTEERKEWIKKARKYAEIINLQEDNAIKDNKVIKEKGYKYLLFRLMKRG